MTGNNRRGVAMKYQMREQMFAIGHYYWIETDGGRPAFEVDGTALRIRKALIWRRLNAELRCLCSKQPLRVAAARNQGVGSG